jgi:hypothetical protein
MSPLLLREIVEAGILVFIQSSAVFWGDVNTAGRVLMARPKTYREWKSMGTA